MIYYVLGLFCVMVASNLFTMYRLGRMTMMRDMWEATASQWQEVAIEKTANDAALGIAMKQKSRGDA